MGHALPYHPADLPEGQNVNVKPTYGHFWINFQQFPLILFTKMQDLPRHNLGKLPPIQHCREKPGEQFGAGYRVSRAFSSFLCPFLNTAPRYTESRGEEETNKSTTTPELKKQPDKRKVLCRHSWGRQGGRDGNELLCSCCFIDRYRCSLKRTYLPDRCAAAFRYLPSTPKTPEKRSKKKFSYLINAALSSREAEQSKQEHHLHLQPQ